MESIAERARSIGTELSLLDDWEDRYTLIIDLGKELPKLSDWEKCEDNRIQGCQSQVWLVFEISNREPETPEKTRLRFRAQSDSVIVQGLAALLIGIYDGMSAAEILAFDAEEFFDRIDLKSHLSANRRGGLSEMVNRIREKAEEVIHSGGAAGVSI
ncbi:MAG: SufE family protein [bacterium]|nr:SufE family protein [bacterium]